MLRDALRPKPWIEPTARALTSLSGMQSCLDIERRRVEAAELSFFFDETAAAGAATEFIIDKSSPVLSSGASAGWFAHPAGVALKNHSQKRIFRKSAKSSNSYNPLCHLERTVGNRLFEVLALIEWHFMNYYCFLLAKWAMNGSVQCESALMRFAAYTTRLFIPFTLISEHEIKTVNPA